jgi:hypothetical protein
VQLRLEPLEDRSLPSVLFRSYDGSGNNPFHPNWGSVNVQLLRTAPAEYGDGISTPGGADRPSAREVSNVIAAHPEDEELSNNRNLSAMIYAFGQFLDHDLDLTTNASPKEPFNITVPTGDPFFDPNSTGTQVITLNRSKSDPTTGTSTRNPRQQINEITAFIDGSMIYGSSEAVAKALRTGVGGRLKTSPGNLLPFNTLGLPNDIPPGANQADFFVAGDIRVNENIELTSLHTLFLREHNRLADKIARENPGLSDDQIYQRARAIVGAELHVITYNEWLPAIFGRDPLPDYQGYNPRVNPGIANEFSTAAFRLGHSLLGEDVEFLDNNAEELFEEIPLREAFNNPAKVVETGIGPILKYLATDPSQELDNAVVDEVRNFLFGQPGQGGFDLPSLNIQRGRDHGLADYNAVRVAYGRPRAISFADITSNTEIQEKLHDLYGNVNNIDLWVGLLAEDHVRGSTLGPTLERILTDQFTRLRDGDRFWYQRVFSGAQLYALEHTTLADIISRNTEINNLQDNVFFFEVRIVGTVFLDRNGNGRQDRDDFGLRNLQVQLFNSAGEMVAITYTSFDGSYRFTNINEPGAFKVKVVAPSWLIPTTPNPKEVTATRGQTLTANFGFRLASQSPLAAVPWDSPFFVAALYQALGQWNP